MESLDTAAISMDDLFDFSSDVGEDDVDGLNNRRPRTALPSLTRNGSDSASLNILNPPDTTSPPFPDFAEAEEELEWLSNKDAFPGVDTFVDVLCNPIPKHQSPVSVLENSNNSSSSTSTDSGSGTVTNCCVGGGGGLSVPVRARSKTRRTRRRDFHSERSCSWWGIEEKVKKPVLAKVSVSIGRKCQHCGAEKTPQWRAGPLGPKTLCNACGVRYKSGRLVPEYMPASSPAFSSELHSNSHRKVMEMRKQKQMKMMRVGTCWG